jgi:hypothetical protein
MTAFSGNAGWRKIAEDQFESILESAVRYPTAFANWLIGIQLCLSPIKEVAILYPASSADLSPFNKTLWSSFQPAVFTAISTFPPKNESPELLKDRPLVDGKTTVYVCQDFVCKRPVTSAEELRALLSE